MGCMTDAVAKVLIAVHRLVHRSPRLRAGLAALVNRLLGERRVNAAIVNATRVGDCVWDVGANVGAYTAEFLARVDGGGRVVAVEPVPSNAVRVAALADDPPLTVVQAALARDDGSMALDVSGPSGETSKLRDAPGAITVRVARGDTLLREGIPAPHVVKIDVEGFEGDVLDGMPSALASARAVVVEIHFAVLLDRGLPEEPLRILNLLRSAGFSVSWLDSSHVLAVR